MHTQPQKEGHRGNSHTETRTHTHARAGGPFVRLCGTPPQRGERPLASTLARAGGVSAGRPPVRFGPGLVDPSWVKIQSPSHHPEPIDLYGTFAPASVQLKSSQCTFCLFFPPLSFLYPSVPLRSPVSLCSYRLYLCKSFPLALSPLCPPQRLYYLNTNEGGEGGGGLRPIGDEGGVSKELQLSIYPAGVLKRD